MPRTVRFDLKTPSDDRPQTEPDAPSLAPAAEEDTSGRGMSPTPRSVPALPAIDGGELLDRVRRSGLIPQVELDMFLTDLLMESRGDKTPDDLLDRLTDARLLTPFQSDRILAGKYKGFLLGGYVILDRLGGGGTGQVFLAEHPALRKLAALKVLPVAAGENFVARERFIREARAAANLDHPNIVKVHDLNQEGPLMYHVMEHIEGLTLQSLVAQAGPLPIGVAVDYARQVAMGLQHIQEHGFVHRDIKPGNLFLTRAGVVKILDFGLVRTDEESQPAANPGTNTILGTADYLAPEQAINCSAVDARADLYSLAATLYFLLVGHPIFPEGKTVQKLMWQQWKEPRPIREIRPEIPEELARIIHKALDKNPDNRHPNLHAMAEDLVRLTSGIFPPPTHLVPMVYSRRWFAWPRQESASPSGIKTLPTYSRPDVYLPATVPVQRNYEVASQTVDSGTETGDTQPQTRSSIFIPVAVTSPTDRIDLSKLDRDDFVESGTQDEPVTSPFIDLPQIQADPFPSETDDTPKLTRNNRRIGAAILVFFLVFVAIAAGITLLVRMH